MIFSFGLESNNETLIPLVNPPAAWLSLVAHICVLLDIIDSMQGRTDYVGEDLTAKLDAKQVLLFVLWCNNISEKI